MSPPDDPAVFWHVGLTVRDLDKSIAFYRDIVGLTPGQRVRSENAAFGKLTNNPGASLEAVFMTAGGFTLQLLQYLAKAGAPLTPGHNHAGSPHLSFFVPDIDAKFGLLQAAEGVAITSEIVTNAAATLRSFYVADPDGVPVEFVERLQGEA